MNLDARATAALEIAAAAGALLLERFHHVTRAGADRKGVRNLVTSADLESEALIRRELARRFPDDGILGEEQGGDLTRRGLVWVVDPLDGTTNFAHELPVWAVSIALVEEGVPRVGVVTLPLIGETFVARAGGGAWLGERRLRVAQTAELAEALLATGFAYERHRAPANNTANMSRMIMAARDVRRMGAAAADLAYVACGRLDGFWEFYLSPWDVAAGALLVCEAGGVVSDLWGGDSWLGGDTIVAANPNLHPRLLEALELT